ncbi:MAG: SDR family oxidoreductase [Longimicrobiales bacterium]
MTNNPPAPVAIVTAGSRGIGRACALELAARGFRVAAFARGEDVAEVADALKAAGAPDAQGVRGSLSDASALADLVDGVLDRWGRIDTVINNSGHAAKGELLELPDDAWHDGVDLLLLNVVRMARAAIPAMEAAGQGSFVNISTFGAVAPDERFPISSVIRTSLTAFTKLFATRYGAAGIRMNNLLPGFVDSYAVDEETVGGIPLERPATTQEIAKVAAFLASEESSYITGQNLLVDGGLVRGI